MGIDTLTQYCILTHHEAGAELLLGLQDEAVVQTQGEDGFDLVQAGHDVHVRKRGDDVLVLGDRAVVGRHLHRRGFDRVLYGGGRGVSATCSGHVRFGPERTMSPHSIWGASSGLTTFFAM